MGGIHCVGQDRSSPLVVEAAPHNMLIFSSTAQFWFLYPSKPLEGFGLCPSLPTPHRTVSSTHTHSPSLLHWNWRLHLLK